MLDFTHDFMPDLLSTIVEVNYVKYSDFSFMNDATVCAAKQEKTTALLERSMYMYKQAQMLIKMYLK